MVWGGRREEGSGWGTHVYLWQIHFDIWQNQYNIVKFKNKIKLKKNNEVQDTLIDFNTTESEKFVNVDSDSSLILVEF